LQKVEDELRLVEGHVIDEATRQPKVSYSLREARAEGDDRATFVYDGTVKLGGDDSFEMRWLINTRRDANGVWSVSNFKEFQ
jgi:hypothetical protein